jgi:hypothetical protein
MRAPQSQIGAQYLKRFAPMGVILSQPETLRPVQPTKPILQDARTTSFAPVFGKPAAELDEIRYRRLRLASPVDKGQRRD